MAGWIDGFHFKHFDLVSLGFSFQRVTKHIDLGFRHVASFACDSFRPHSELSFVLAIVSYQKLSIFGVMDNPSDGFIVNETACIPLVK